jgi:DNA-directed RNA polymerase subunit M/transcription elongation factor TFIIS
VKQLLPCPDCQRLLLLPEATAANAQLRCPQCGEQHTVDEIYSRLESWIVVDEPHTSQAENADSAETLAATTSSHTGDSRLETDGSSKNSTAAGLSVAHVSYARLGKLGRKKRSALWSVFQVALGGIAAVPISLLLIWHVIGTDIAGAGPAVSRYIPWIVPKQFHADDVTSPGPSPRIRFTPPPARGESGFRQFDNELEPDWLLNSDAEPETNATQPETGDDKPSDSGSESEAGEQATVAK